MSWADLFDRAAAFGIDEATVRAALVERRADGVSEPQTDAGDDNREANSP